MGDLLIRDVDDQLIRTLKSKAEINGTSLQHEAKRALSRGAPLGKEEKSALFAELDRLWGERPPSAGGAVVVREMREESDG